MEKLGNITLYNADCIDILRGMPSDLVDCIVKKFRNFLSVMTMINNHYCGECRWMFYEDTDGDGFCGLNSEGMAEVPVRCDKRACKDFEAQQDGNTCGECLLFETEDGSPYCLAKDLYTSAYAEDPACEEFIKIRNSNENE